VCRSVSEGSDCEYYSLWGCDIMYEVWSEISGLANTLLQHCTWYRTHLLCGVKSGCVISCSCWFQSSSMSHCVLWLCVVPSAISAPLGIYRPPRTVCVHHFLLQVRQNFCGNLWGIKTSFFGETVSRMEESDWLSKFRSGVTCMMDDCIWVLFCSQ